MSRFDEGGADPAKHPPRRRKHMLVEGDPKPDEGPSGLSVVPTTTALILLVLTFAWAFWDLYR